MKQLLILLRFDFRALRYAGQQLAAIATFALLLTVLSSIVFRRVGMGEQELLAITPGMLLLLFSFTGVIAVRVLSALESEGEALLGLVLSGVDPWVLYLAKYLRTAAVILVVNVSILVWDAMFFGVDFRHFGNVVAVTVLFSLGLSAIGTLLGLVAQISRLGELLLPLMLFPLLLPLIFGAYELLTQLLAPIGVERMSAAGWSLSMVMFDILALLLSAVLFEFVVKE